MPKGMFDTTNRNWGAHTPNRSDVYHFRQEVAKDLSEYVLTSLSRSAKKYDAPPPDVKKIKSVLVSVPWEDCLESMGTVGKFRKFIKKYIALPIDRVVEKIPIDAIYSILIGAIGTYNIRKFVLKHFFK